MPHRPFGVPKRLAGRRPGTVFDMGMGTGIEWADHSWNPWQGCHPLAGRGACSVCYAMREMSRYGKNPHKVIRSAKKTFELPVSKGRGGDFKLKFGERVFACSWSDWFHKDADEWRDEAWEIIRMRPDLVFMILTKRVLRIEECLPADWGEGWENVWLGSSVEDRWALDSTMGAFLRVPAKVHFLSCEPLLGPVDLSPWLADGELKELFVRCYGRAPVLDWVICGGETGPGASSPDVEWVRLLRDQCRAHEIPFFFKRWGGDADRASRELDGVTHDALPAAYGAWSIGNAGRMPAVRGAADGD